MRFAESFVAIFKNVETSSVWKTIFSWGFTELQDVLDLIPETRNAGTSELFVITQTSSVVWFDHTCSCTHVVWLHIVHGHPWLMNRTESNRTSSSDTADFTSRGSKNSATEPNHVHVTVPERRDLWERSCSGSRSKESRRGTMANYRFEAQNWINGFSLFRQQLYWSHVVTVSPALLTAGLVGSRRDGGHLAVLLEMTSLVWMKRRACHSPARSAPGWCWWWRWNGRACAQAALLGRGLTGSTCVLRAERSLSGT